MTEDHCLRYMMKYIDPPKAKERKLLELLTSKKEGA